MPSNFPASFDALTNPTSGDALTSPSHSSQHTNANDIIEALETHAGLSGTAFPASPATGARFRRTDRNLDYYYDGTRWLTTEIFTMRFASDVVLPSSVAYSLRGIPRVTDEMWLLELRGSARVQTTNDATNHWSITVQKIDGVTATNICNSFTTDGGGASTWFGQQRAIIAGQELITTAIDAFEMRCAPVGAPGAMWDNAELFYRRVG